MGLVAGGALGHFGMKLMTFVAAQFGMGVGTPGGGRNRIRVAGETDPFGFGKAGEVNIQRFVRIVTGRAIGQGIMRLSAGIVAFTALGGRLAPLQRMAGVTATTADFLVGGTASGEESPLFIVAIDAIPGDHPDFTTFGPTHGAGKKKTPQKARQN